MGGKRLFLAMALVLVTLAVIVYRGRRADRRPPVPQDSDPISSAAQVDQDSVILSPQKDRGVAVIEQMGRSEIWVISVADNRRSLVKRLQREEGARSIRWSPDDQFFAFEAYNVAGHSPMTTTHVWVAMSDGTALREVRLPAPNQRFSTYLDRWIAGDTLRIRSTLLEHPEDVFFLYHSAAGRLEGPVKEGRP